MPKGIRLSDGREGTAVGRHVHCKGGTWSITSKVPVGPAMLSQPPLDRLLPGMLGCYVYPSDAVFHLHDRAHTTQADWEAVAAAEHVSEAREEWVNHLTVDLLEARTPEEEEEEESEDEFQGEEEEEENEHPAEEEAWSEEDD